MRRLSIQWAGVLLGPIAAALNQVASYALVQWECGNHSTTVIKLVTVAALIAIAAGGWAAWTAYSTAPSAAAGTSERVSEEGVHYADRQRFMGILGLLSTALFAALVVAMDIPKWVLDACQQ